MLEFLCREDPCKNCEIKQFCHDCFEDMSCNDVKKLWAIGIEAEASEAEEK